VQEQKLEMNKPISEIKFAAIDTETTGFSPACGNRICEVGVVKTLNWKVTEVYESFINPLIDIPPQVSAIHSITDDMVRDAPTFREIAGEFKNVVGRSVLVFHNAAFDLAFIQSELMAAGLEPLDNIIVDTLKILRRAFSFPSNSLTSITDYLDIPHETSHRALSDAAVTIQVLEYIVRELKIESLSRLLEYSR